MKRFFNILILISVAVISGCMKSEIIDPQSQSSIEFCAYIDKNSTTRGEVVTSDIVGDLGRLEAFNSGGELWDDRTSSPSQYMDVTLSVDEDGVISSSSVASWPADSEYLTFYGYYPTSELLTAIAPTATTSFALEYTTNPTPDSQPDVIFTEVMDKNVDNSADGVTLHYKHILSKIDIQAKMSMDYKDDSYIVTDVKLTYPSDVLSKAKYCCVDGVWGWDFDGYSSTMGGSSTTYSMLSNDEGVVVSDEGTSIIDSDKYLMLLPQQLSGLTVYVTYKNCYDEVITRSALAPSYTLEPGYQYNYILTLKADDLIFDVIIEQEWGEAIEVKTPIYVSSIMMLSMIGNDDNYPLDGDYVLINDINAEFYDDFINIANFSGTFDGGGYSINNLKEPIFESVTGATIENLNVELSKDITFDGQYYGAIVGEAASSTIMNCSISGNSINAAYAATSARTGGVVGSATSCDIIGCYNSCDISSYYNTGGIVGYASSCNVIGCYNTGDINATHTTPRIGGIAGYVSECTLSACYNSGTSYRDTFTEGSYIAGITGYISSTSTVDSSCYTQHAVMSIGEGVMFNSLDELSVDVLNAAITAAGYGANVQFYTSGGDALPNLRGESTASFVKVMDSSTHAIFTIDDLSQTPYSSGAYSLMMNNITFTSTSSSWSPIGVTDSASNYYNGTFEGNNKTITGLYINNTVDSKGLIYRVNASATVQNLTMSAPNISGITNVGSVTGANYGTLTNCSVVGGSIIGSSNAVGGITGYNKGFISNCSNSGASVSGTAYVGGVVGWQNENTDTTAYIKDCVASGAIVKGTSTSTNGCIGGIVGYALKGYISGCTVSNETNLTGSTYGAGGVVGSINASSVSDCVVSNLTAAATKYIGGVVGYSISGGAINDCSITTGSLIATVSESHTGGIVGYLSSSSCDDCSVSGIYAAGVENIGGVVGYALSSSTTNCDSKSGTVISTSNYAGGVAGRIYASTLSNTTATSMSVSSDNYAGGVVGYATGDSVVNLCHIYSGSVATTTNYSGGVIGAVLNSYISRCSNKGATVSGAQYIGGVVGNLGASTTTTGSLVIGCYNTAAVTGTSYYVGGVVGFIKDDVVGCYNTGKVGGDYEVGGIVGRLAKDGGTLYSGYNTGAVTKTHATNLSVGDIIGKAYSALFGSFYYVDVSSDSSTTDVGVNSTGETLTASTSTTTATLNSSTVMDVMNTAIQAQVSGYTDVVFVAGATTPTFAW